MCPFLGTEQQGPPAPRRLKIAPLFRRARHELKLTVVGTVPQAAALLILADAGQQRLPAPVVEKQLQEALTDRFGLVVTVCHYPTGASKWTPVEHRLLGPIGTSWAGTQLRRPEIMLECLRGTRTPIDPDD